MEREFLKRQQRTLPKKVSKVRLYETKRYSFPITLMARLLHVSVSCFMIGSRVSKRTIQRNQQTILVKIAHEETKQSYGYIRLTKYLQAQGIK